MDLLERGLRGMGVRLIRIDGSTAPQKRYVDTAQMKMHTTITWLTCTPHRHELQTQFQTDVATHAALLSITACAMGLNLTAASVACFAELHWVPGTLFQVRCYVYIYSCWCWMGPVGWLGYVLCHSSITRNRNIYTGRGPHPPARADGQQRALQVPHLRRVRACIYTHIYIHTYTLISVYR